MLDCLDIDQVRRYLLWSEKLKEGEKLAAATERFPPQARTVVHRVIERELAATSRDE